MNRKPSVLATLVAVTALALGSLSPAQALQFSQIASPESASVQRIFNDGGSLYTLVGHRIHKSTDGSSWSVVTPPAGRLPDQMVAGGGRITVAAGGRVQSSTDDGASWQDITGDFEGEISDLFAAGGTHFVYTFEFVNFRSTPRLYRYDGTGNSYTLVTPPGIDGVSDVVGAGSNLCALVRNSGVRWSNNNGDSWSSASGVNGNFGSIGVSPDGTTVLVASASSSATIRRSTNSCQSFGSFGSPSASTGTVSSLGVDAAGNFYVGMHNGDLLKSPGTSTYELDNNGSLVAATGIPITAMAPFGSGMLVATSGLGVHGNAGGDWAKTDQGLVGSHITGLIPLDGADAVGLSQFGGYFTSSDAGAVAFSPSNDGLNLRRAWAVLKVDSTTLLLATDASVDFSSSPFTGAPGLFRSTDSGATWTQADADTSGLPAGASLNDLETDGTTVFALVTSTANGDQPLGVYKSTDGGVTWTADADGNLAGNSVSIRNLAARGSTVWAYRANSGVFRTTDGGASWTAVNNGLGSRRFGKVFATPSALVASASGIVYRSTDNGDTWVETTGFAISRFGIELLSMAEDAAGVVYLGDEHAGLSVSTDGGATWVPDSDGLPQAEVCIPRIEALLALNGKVYAGTGGSGLFVTDALGAGTAGDSVECTTDVDVFPNAFRFTAQTGVEPATLVQSNTANISGLGNGVTVPISVQGGEYSIGCDGTFTDQPGEIGNGPVCVRHTSAARGETSVSTTLTVGDQSGTFTSTTGLVFTGRDDEVNTGFGNGGLAVNTAINRSATSVALEAGGGVVIGGTVFINGANKFAVGRFTADGAVGNFADNASSAVIVDIADDDRLEELIVQPDGKLLLIGSSYDSNGTPQNGIDDIHRIAVVRLNADGSFDTGFGSDGIAAIDINPNDQQRWEFPGAAVLLADGSIVIGGWVLTSDAGGRFFLIKLNADGSVDTDFGNNEPDRFIAGVGSVPGGSTSGAVAALHRTADGQFVMVASAINNNQRSSVALQFNADGTPDTAYGVSNSGAAVIPDFGGVQDAVLLADDQLLVAGYTTVDGRRKLSTTRLNADGSVDTTYGVSGVQRYEEPSLAFSFSHNFVSLLALADGRFAATIIGPQDGTTSNALYYMVLLADGTLDPNIGADGEGFVYRGPINNNPLIGRAMVQRADGGVIVAGFAAGENDTSSNSGAMALVFGGGDGGPVDDTVPDAFDFADLAAVEPGTVQTSETVTVSGINAATDYSVVGGEVSLNGGEFSSASGSLVNGDTVQLRHTSAAEFDTDTTTTLTIGGVSGSFVSTTRAGDAMPDAFAFTDVDQVELSTVITSNTVTVGGIEVSVSISITGGEYAIGCDSTAFTDTDGTIDNGQTVCVRHTSAATEETATNTTLTIGGVSDTFTSTTRGAVILDSTPDAFSFVDRFDVAPGSVVTSDPITVSGIDTAAQVEVVGGEYSIGCDADLFTASPGTIDNGQSVCVRHTASADFETVTNTELTIGGVSDTFSSTTSADPANGETEQVNTPSGAPAEVRTSTGLIENLVNSATPPAGSTPPAGVSFDDGFFAFDITGLTVGGTTTVTITLPAGAAPDTYYKVINGNFFEFLFDGTDGAQINGNVITLTLVDGGRGDADGVANGTIVDPGAPGSSTAAGTPVSGSSSGGAFNPLLLGLLLVIGALRRRLAAWLPVLALLVSAPASALDWGISASAGVGKDTFSAAEMSAELNRRGHNVTVQKDKHFTGFSLKLSTPVDENADLVLGWHYLDGDDIVLNGTSSDPSRLPKDVADLTAGYGHGFSAGVRLRIPMGGPRLLFTPEFAGILSRDESDVVINGRRSSERETAAGFSMSLGFAWAMTRQLELHTAWRLLRYSSEQVSTLALAGLALRFDTR